MELLVAIASANVALCQALHKCLNCVDLTHDGGDICQQTAQTCRHLLAIHVHLPCEVTVDDYRLHLTSGVERLVSSCDSTSLS